MPLRKLFETNSLGENSLTHIGCVDDRCVIFWVQATGNDSTASEKKSCLNCKPITSSEGISRNYNLMRRSMLNGARPIGINQTYNSMRKTMLDGANLNGNMTEAAACKPRRYNAHKPLQVCP